MELIEEIKIYRYTEYRRRQFNEMKYKNRGFIERREKNRG